MSGKKLWWAVSAGVVALATGSVAAVEASSLASSPCPCPSCCGRSGPDKSSSEGNTPGPVSRLARYLMTELAMAVTGTANSAPTTPNR